MLKRFILVILSVVFVAVMAFTGCNNQKTADTSLITDDSSTTDTSLTLDTIIRLSKKGEDLTWQDFENYESEDVGSGLRIYHYEIDEQFYLHIGGASMEEKPFYIRLISTDDRDDYIDIRTENVKEFIVAHTPSDS